MMASAGADKPRARRTSVAARQPQATKEKAGPRQYLSEVRAELKKVAWPTKKEVTTPRSWCSSPSSFMTALIFVLDYGSSKFVLFLFD